MLISTFAWWALAAVVGLGVATVLALVLLRRDLAGTAGQRGLISAWSLVAAGALLELVAGAGWSRAPHGTGGALIITGVLVLARSIDVLGSDRDRRPIWWVMLAVVPLVAAAVALPAPLWRALYGVALLAAALWLAAVSRGRHPRNVFGGGAVMVAVAGLGLLYGGVRPPWSASSDVFVSALLLSGLVALAAATIVDRLAAEASSLRRQLSTLEDDHEHLLRLAETDPLTGCPTRQALRAWFDRWEGGEPVSVVLIDVDGLKRINERHGQDAGDEALRLVANVLSSSIRPGDLVVRWGGDEFVALLRGAGHEAARRRFTSLIGTLEERAGDFAYEEPLGVHWGVSSCSSAADVSRALAEADERMYAMKRRQVSSD